MNFKSILAIPLFIVLCCAIDITASTSNGIEHAKGPMTMIPATIYGTSTMGFRQLHPSHSVFTPIIFSSYVQIEETMPTQTKQPSRLTLAKPGSGQEFFFCSYILRMVAPTVQASSDKLMRLAPPQSQNNARDIAFGECALEFIITIAAAVILQSNRTVRKPRRSQEACEKQESRKRNCKSWSWLTLSKTWLGRHFFRFETAVQSDLCVPALMKLVEPESMVSTDFSDLGEVDGDESDGTEVEEEGNKRHASSQASTCLSQNPSPAFGEETSEISSDEQLQKFTQKYEGLLMFSGFQSTMQRPDTKDLSQCADYLHRASVFVTHQKDALVLLQEAAEEALNTLAKHKPKYTDLAEDFITVEIMLESLINDDIMPAAAVIKEWESIPIYDMTGSSPSAMFKRATHKRILRRVTESIWEQASHAHQIRKYRIAEYTMAMKVFFALAKVYELRNTQN